MYLYAKNKMRNEKHLEELHQLGIFHKKDVLSFMEFYTFAHLSNKLKIVLL